MINFHIILLAVRRISLEAVNAVLSLDADHQSLSM